MSTVKDLNDSDLKAYKYFCKHCWTEKQPPTEDQFRDKYHGIWDNVANFVMNYYDDVTRRKYGSLWSYIDWDDVWNGEFQCDSWSAEFIQGEGYAIFE